jgi:hypothetical protein
MRSFPDLPSILGSLALAGTLALLSPGVAVVRADDSHAEATLASSSDGATCEAGTINGGDEATAILRRIQQLQIEQMKRSAPTEDSDGEAIVLNNRGYNYGPADMALPHPQELQRER